tara:strand:+ start:1524 stop:2315 length:792 start_codon:yes stop_codon:yes gene_type:complete
MSIITSNKRGTAFTLPEGSKGVMTGIELCFAKRKELKVLINTVAVASIQCCIDNGHDDSAIRKLMTGLISGGIKTGSDYDTYKRMLEKCGLYCDFEGSHEKKESIDNELVIDKKKFAKLLKDDAAKTEMYDMLYDVLNVDDADMWDTFQSKPDKRPKAAKKKADAVEGDTEAGEVTTVNPVDDKITKLRDTLSLVAGDNPKKCDQLVTLLERLLDVGIVMEQPANVLQMLENQGIFKKLEGQTKVQGMVDKLKKLHAGNSAKV